MSLPPPPPPPAKALPQFVVRMPDDEFRSRIAASAAENGRSMNGEILERLRRFESLVRDLDSAKSRIAVLEREVAMRAHAEEAARFEIRNLQGKLSEQGGAAYLLKEELNRKEKGVSWGEHVEKTNLLLDLQRATELRLRDQSRILNLVCAVVPKMWEAVPLKERTDETMEMVVHLALDIARWEGETPAKALEAFMTGKLDPTAAARMRGALDTISDLATRLAIKPDKPIAKRITRTPPKKK